MKSLHVVGDSISMHYGPFLERFLRPWFRYSRKEGKAGNLDNPEGANGGDSGMVLDYLNECVAEGRRWEVLLLNCGLHDIKRYDGRVQVGPEAYERNLRGIFERAHALAARLLWVRTTPVIDTIHNSRMADFQRFDADVERYNAIADRVALAAGAELIDLNTFTRALGGDELFADHVHYTEAVQALQAAFLVGQIVTPARGSA